MQNLKVTVTTIAADTDGAIEALEEAIGAIKFNRSKFSTAIEVKAASNVCFNNSYQIQVEETEEDVTSLCFAFAPHAGDRPRDFDDIGW